MLDETRKNALANIPAREGFDSYYREGFHKVRGWSSPNLHVFLKILDHAQYEHGVSGGVAEIGVQDGKFFLGLHNLLREGEKSLAIDVFDDHNLNVDGSGEAALETVKQNFKEYGNGGSFNYIKSDSIDIDDTEIADIVSKYGKFRLFSVDGSHTLRHTMHDFYIAEKSLCPGGIIMVDDYFNPYWPEVHQAIIKVMEGSNSKLWPLFFQCGKMFFTTPGFRDRYKEYCVKYIRGENSSEPIKICNLFGQHVVYFSQRST